MDDVREYLGLPAAGGPTGAGVRVAVIDTGIDPSHVDLEHAYDEANSRDLSGSRHGIRDTETHGTHVAGIIAGRGRASDGAYLGVAPESTIVAIKMSEGPQWEPRRVARGLLHAMNVRADIINFSAQRFPFAQDMPTPWVFGPPAILDRQFTRASNKGILCVVAAGNDGPKLGTVSYPAGMESVLAVGSVWPTDGAMFEESSRGPFRWSTRVPTESCTSLENISSWWQRSRVKERMKPDVAAPGAEIHAPLSTQIPLPRQRALGQMAGSYDGRYQEMSGTSQAAAVVSGLAACLLGYLRVAKAPMGRNPGAVLRAILIHAAAMEDGFAPHDIGAGVLRWPAIQAVADRYIASRTYRLRLGR
jgi:subtilisin family serine protease